MIRDSQSTAVRGAGISAQGLSSGGRSGTILGQSSTEVPVVPWAPSPSSWAGVKTPTTTMESGTTETHLIRFARFWPTRRHLANGDTSLRHRYPVWIIGIWGWQVVTYSWSVGCMRAKRSRITCGMQLPKHCWRASFRGASSIVLMLHTERRLRPFFFAPYSAREDGSDSISGALPSTGSSAPRPSTAVKTATGESNRKRAKC